MLHRLLRNGIMENHTEIITEPEFRVNVDHALFQQLQLWKAIDFGGKFFF